MAAPDTFRKAYLAGSRPGIQVPVREVALTTGDSFRLYDTSGPPAAADEPLPPLRAGWINERLARPGSVTQRACARRGEITPEMEFAAIREGVPAELVRAEPAAGRAVPPASVNHPGSEPMVIGKAFLIKINANIGTSATSSSVTEEVAKMRWATRWGADTLMDLSTGKRIHQTREGILRGSPFRSAPFRYTRPRKR